MGAQQEGDLEARLAAATVHRQWPLASTAADAAPRLKESDEHGVEYTGDDSLGSIDHFHSPCTVCGIKRVFVIDWCARTRAAEKLFFEGGGKYGATIIKKEPNVRPRTCD